MDATWAPILDHSVAQLDRDIAAGRRHLLTEDRVRWAVIAGLQASGIDASRMLTEYRIAGVGPVDLVVDNPPSVVVELKFPRDPTAKNAPDTMTTGELLKDFARLAICPAETRMAVQVIPDRLRGHLERRRDVRWAWSPGERLELTPATVAGLPRTARESLRLAEFEGHIRASCVFNGRAGDLTVLGYQVAANPGVLRFRPR